MHRSNADQLVTHLKRLAAKLLPTDSKLSTPPQPSKTQLDTSSQRRCQSEILFSHDKFSSSYIQSDPKSSTVTNKVEAFRHQPYKATEPKPHATNDVPLNSSSCIGVTNACKSVPDTPQDSNFVQRLPSTAKLPAQAEWERLWYSGVSLAFQEITHYFPELRWKAVNNSTSTDISEPTLAVSSLKAEDRSLFNQEEKASLTSSFAPKSEEERLSRLHCCHQAVDDIQRQALLLGLPTFDEYLERKSIAVAQLQRQSGEPSKRQLKREAKFIQKKQHKTLVKSNCEKNIEGSAKDGLNPENPQIHSFTSTKSFNPSRGVMTHERKSSKESTPSAPALHRPLVVGLTKPQSARSTSTMASSSEAAALNKEIEANIKSNTQEAGPSADNPTAPPSQKPKKEKAPKQPKPQKAAAPVAPTSPALIDLRVGHILRAITHPNADSLYVSTIAMGDEEGTEHTQIDEETGKVVRTVCSGLNGLVPLEEMQGRKIIVVANLKPVNMRSIKSAAMVLAASPKQPEDADPHAADRVVELVTPPEGSEAGDKVYFEGWPYGDGKGPEKVLNPKKKQWEAIQPGFYTSDDLVVGFDASSCEEVEGSAKGNLVVEGRGSCTVKTLKGAVVR